MFENLVFEFLQLVGVAALISALVNVGKAFGIVPDGAASNVSAGLSFTAFIAFVALKLFKPDVDFLVIDSQSKQIAEFTLYVLGFFIQMGLPAKFHQFLTGIPFFGYSFSEERWKSEKWKAILSSESEYDEQNDEGEQA